MSDLIDRQAVLNTLDNMDKALDEERTVEKYKELLTECIKVLPSVENKGGWNPLESDEEGMIIGSLPEEGKEVFITVYGQVEIDSFGCDVEYDESVGECRCEWFCENNDIEDVRAWMPLPEPYKADMRGDT